jgi:transposase-like protein
MQFKQNVAAHAVKFCVEPALSAALEVSERMVERRQRGEPSRKAPKATRKAMPSSWATSDTALASGAARSTLRPMISNMAQCIRP